MILETDVCGMVRDEFGGTLTPKFARIQRYVTSTAGRDVVVPAVAGKKIRVLAYCLGANNSTEVQWFSDTATSLTGLMSLAAQNYVSTCYGTQGHFETNSGEALTMNVTLTNVNVSGHLLYVEK